MSVTIEVSYGELIDKITILEIKADKVKDLAKLNNIRTELDVLKQSLSAEVQPSPQVSALTVQLRDVNNQLWEIEDLIRDKERTKTFDEEFIRLARSVYITNDVRAKLKRELNDLLGSKLVEEKDYKPY
ncbi:MAG: DUF6165 family protein [Thiobacillaceae bacterium]